MRQLSNGNILRVVISVREAASQERHSPVVGAPVDRDREPVVGLRPTTVRQALSAPQHQRWGWPAGTPRGPRTEGAGRRCAGQQSTSRRDRLVRHDHAQDSRHRRLLAVPFRTGLHAPHI